MTQQNVLKLPEMAQRVEPSHKGIVCEARVSRSEVPFVFKNGDVRITMVIPNPDDPTQIRRVQARFASADGWNAELVGKFLPRGATFQATLDLYPPREQTDKAGAAVINPRTNEAFYNQTVVLHDATNIVKPELTKLAKLAAGMAKAAAAAAAPKQDAPAL